MVRLQEDWKLTAGLAAVTLKHRAQQYHNNDAAAPAYIESAPHDAVTMETRSNAIKPNTI